MNTGFTRRHFCGLLSLVVLLVLSAPPVGAARSKQKKASRADADEIEQVEHAIKELEYDRARDILLVIIASPSANEQTLLDAHTLNGIVQRVLENDVEARLSFVYVLEHRPDYELPTGLSPKVTNFFELVRSEVAKRSTSLLSIETQPPGARVRLGAEDIGVTPIRRNVEPGRYDLTIAARDDGREHSFKVNVEAIPGKETSVRATLFQQAASEKEQEAYQERKAWHSVLLVGKLIGACVLIPSCGCCLAGNPLARGDLTQLNNMGNVACLPVSLVGLLSGLGLGLWGGADLVLGPKPPPLRVYHRIEVIPPVGHGKREESEITVDFVEQKHGMGF